MISEKLLSLVLDEDYSVIGEVTELFVNENHLYITIELDGLVKSKTINIDTLTRKMKEFILKEEKDCVFTLDIHETNKDLIIKIVKHTDDGVRTNEFKTFGDKKEDTFFTYMVLVAQWVAERKGLL